MQDQIKDEWIEAARNAYSRACGNHAPWRAVLAAVAPLIRAEAEAGHHLLGNIARQADTIAALRADLAQAQAQNEALNLLLRNADETIAGYKLQLAQAQALLREAHEHLAASRQTIAAGTLCSTSWKAPYHSAQHRRRRKICNAPSRSPPMTTDAEIIEAIERDMLAALSRKYVQRADARQREMGLVYTEAETHDLARFVSHTAFTICAPAVRERCAEWQPIETAPKGEKLIVGYKNRNGYWRTVLATYYPPNTLEHGDEYDGDEEFAPEGWYEEAEENETILSLSHEPTHWMPLPEPPAAPAQSKGESE